MISSHEQLILATCLVANLATACAAPAVDTDVQLTAPTSAPTSVQLNAPTSIATYAPTDTDTPVPPTATSTATAAPAPTRTAGPTRAPTVAAPTKAPTTTAPTAVPPQAVPAATSETSSDDADFTPKVNSVWETAIGQDNMSGTCTGGPILPAYGLVQIIPNGDTLTWLSQEPAPYTFFRTAPSTFYYSGPTSTGDGAVTMTLRFTSATSLTMQRVFTPNNDPACQHTHNYSGQFQWNVP